MKTTSKQYIDILETIFYVRVITKKSIGILTERTSTATEFIKAAIEAKHIKEKIVKDKRGTSRRLITVYLITKTGINYLIETKQDNRIFNIIENLDQYNIWSDSETHSNIIIRVINESIAMILCKKAEIQIPYKTMFERKILEDEETSTTSVLGQQILKYINDTIWETDCCFNKKKSKASINSDNDTEQDKETEIIYYGKKEIIENANNKNTSASIRQIIHGRMLGILDSTEKTSLLYVANPFYMKWDDFSVESEYAIIRMWKTFRSQIRQELKTQTGQCGIIIVENTRDFQNVYFNRYFKRQTSGDFGGMLDHLYVVPNSIEGAKQLRWIMSSVDQEEINRLTENAVETGLFNRNDEPTKKEFQLRNNEGNEVAIGFLMDGKTMSVIEKIAKARSDKTFYVLCFEWQRKYYERILPANVKYYTTE